MARGVNNSDDSCAIMKINICTDIVEIENINEYE